MIPKPLAIDLFCGLGGWTEGLLAEGYRVVGFDVERHRYPARDFTLAEEHGKGMAGKNANGTTLINAAREQVYGFHTAPLTGGWHEYPSQLVLQDVLTIHGRQFASATLIVASPPCQAYSYRAMPWKRAKALPPPDNSLFEACFRIQREAIEATRRTCRSCGGDGLTRGCCRCETCAGTGVEERHIPLVVENVRGAQPYVGRARWHFGSFYLWGDIPALMPMTKVRAKVPGLADGRFPPGGLAQGAIEIERNKNLCIHGTHWSAECRECGIWRVYPKQDEAVKVLSESGRRTDVGNGARFTSRDCGVEATGVKQGGDWFNAASLGGDGMQSISRRPGSKSSARKAASAHIAKIPLVLARHIARAWHPDQC